MITSRQLLLLVHRKSTAFLWHLRCRYYSILLSAKELKINGRVKIICPEKIKLGEHVSLNDGCIINAAGGISIGDRSHISPGCIINSGELDINVMSPDKRIHLYRPVTIEDDVWIASGVIVNPGVRIGSGCVIAAGSVVTKDVPSGHMAVGIPARVVRTI